MKLGGQILLLYSSLISCFNNSSSFAFYINVIHILKTFYLLWTTFSDPFIFSGQCFLTCFPDFNSLLKFLFKSVIFFRVYNFTICNLNEDLFNVFDLLLPCFVVVVGGFLHKFLNFKFLIPSPVCPSVYVSCVCVWW